MISVIICEARNIPRCKNTYVKYKRNNNLNHFHSIENIKKFKNLKRYPYLVDNYLLLYAYVHIQTNLACLRYEFLQNRYYFYTLLLIYKRCPEKISYNPHIFHFKNQIKNLTLC